MQTGEFLGRAIVMAQRFQHDQARPSVAASNPAAQRICKIRRKKRSYLYHQLEPGITGQTMLHKGRLKRFVLAHWVLCWDMISQEPSWVLWTWNHKMIYMLIGLHSLIFNIGLKTKNQAFYQP